jgi:hypothetical protein
MTDVTPPPAPPTTPLWEDLIDIFVSPSAVFARRREDPTFFFPLLVVTVVIGLIMFGTKDLMAPIFDAEFARAMVQAQKQNPNLTPEQMEGMKTFGRTAATFGGFIIIPIAIALVGVVSFIVAKTLSAATTIGQAMMIGALAYVPRIVAAILGAVQAAVMDPSSLNSQFAIHIGPARFLDVTTTSLALVTLAGRFELFTLWSTVLVAIGLQVTGKISGQKAAIGGFLVWLVASLWPLWGALRAGGITE